MKLSNEFKVGIMAVIAIIILILGFNYLKGKNLFSVEKKIILEVNAISGLTKANQVILYGMQVGSVEDIEMLSNGNKHIRVSLRIRPDVNIPNTSKARIFNKDILGIMAVELLPEGNGTPVKSGDKLECITDLSFADNVTAIIQPLQERVTNLVVSIDTIINGLNVAFNQKSRKNLQNTFASLEHSMVNIEATTENFKNLSETQSHKLKAILSNVESITQNFKNNNAVITQAINNFHNISDSLAKSNLKHTITEASIAVKQASIILTKINNGEGSVGQLINNKELYNNLETSSKDLDLLLVDLKQNPKRYIHFSVFGAKEKKKKK